MNTTCANVLDKKLILSLIDSNSDEIFFADAFGKKLVKKKMRHAIMPAEVFTVQPQTTMAYLCTCKPLL